MRNTKLANHASYHLPSLEGKRYNCNIFIDLVKIQKKRSNNNFLDLSSKGKALFFFMFISKNIKII